MDKAERIYTELVSENAAIWYISDEYGSKVMVKVTTPGIKAVIKGCKIELIFGRDESHHPNIFHIGLKIHDDALNYQILSRTHRYLDEHLSIAKILHIDKVQIELYNELNVCQAFGDLILKDEDKHEILALLINPKKLYTGDFNKQIEESLDRFHRKFTANEPVPCQTLHLATVEAKIIHCNAIQNCLYQEGGGSVDTYIAGNEGEELEKEVFAVLYTLFQNNTIKNPRIPFKNASRELTDILAFSDLGIFLIETKALSVINIDTDRTMERKVAGLQKQINKAINQLEGAIKRVAEGTPIYDAMGNDLQFNRKLVPHVIILISEFLPFGEWEKIYTAMLRVMMDTTCFIHVLDMREFMQYIGYANGDKYLFDDFFVQRIKHFVKHPTLFQRLRFIDKPSDT